MIASPSNLRIALRPDPSTRDIPSSTNRYRLRERVPGMWTESANGAQCLDRTDTNESVFPRRSGGGSRGGAVHGFQMAHAIRYAGIANKTCAGSWRRPIWCLCWIRKMYAGAGPGNDHDAM